MAIVAPLIAAAGAQAIRSLFGLFSAHQKRARIPKALDWQSELPPEMSALLDEITGGQLQSINQQAGTAAGMRERGLRARGIFDAPTLGAATASTFGIAAPLRLQALSEKAQNKLGAIRDINLFNTNQRGQSIQAAGMANQYPDSWETMGNILSLIPQTIGDISYMRGKGAENDQMNALYRKLIERLLGAENPTGSAAGMLGLMIPGTPSRYSGIGVPSAYATPKLQLPDPPDLPGLNRVRDAQLGGWGL